MTMRVQFTRGTALGGIDNDAYPGDVRDLPAPDAMRLIASGRAIPAPPPQPQAEPDAPARKPKPQKAP